MEVIWTPILCPESQCFEMYMPNHMRKGSSDGIVTNPVSVFTQVDALLWA